jgi:hypothetical protein
MRILFRFVLSNKTVWVGYTEGKTWEEIYHGIDEFGDAYEADVIQLHRAVPMRFCVPLMLHKKAGWVPSNEEYGGMSGKFWDAVPDVSDFRWDAETKAQLAWKDYLKNRTGKRYGD